MIYLSSALVERVFSLPNEELEVFIRSLSRYARVSLSLAILVPEETLWIRGSKDSGTPNIRTASARARLASPSY